MVRPLSRPVQPAVSQLLVRIGSQSPNRRIPNTLDVGRCCLRLILFIHANSDRPQESTHSLTCQFRRSVVQLSTLLFFLPCFLYLLGPSVLSLISLVWLFH